MSFLFFVVRLTFSFLMYNMIKDKNKKMEVEMENRVVLASYLEDFERHLIEQERCVNTIKKYLKTKNEKVRKEQ